MFAGPFGSGADAGAYVAIAFLATATAFALFQVPYVAMPAELTDGYAERTRLMTWRVAVLALAILVSGALAPLVVEQTGGGLTGHRWAGAFVGALIVVGTLGTFFGTRTAPTRSPQQSEPSLRAQLRVAAANAPVPRPARLLRHPGRRHRHDAGRRAVLRRSRDRARRPARRSCSPPSSARPCW